jgi:hypothetical protein
VSLRSLSCASQRTQYKPVRARWHQSKLARINTPRTSCQLSWKLRGPVRPRCGLWQKRSMPVASQHHAAGLGMRCQSRTFWIDRWSRPRRQKHARDHPWLVDRRHRDSRSIVRMLGRSLGALWPRGLVALVGSATGQETRADRA